MDVGAFIQKEGELYRGEDDNQFAFSTGQVGCHHSVALRCTQPARYLSRSCNGTS